MPNKYLATSNLDGREGGGGCIMKVNMKELEGCLSTWAINSTAATSVQLITLPCPTLLIS